VARNSVDYYCYKHTVLPVWMHLSYIQLSRIRILLVIDVCMRHLDTADRESVGPKRGEHGGANCLF